MPASNDAELSTTLETWNRLDAARRRRSGLANLTALLSVPVGALALWPGALDAVGERALLTFWGMSLAATAHAVGVELHLTVRAFRHRSG